MKMQSIVVRSLMWGLAGGVAAYVLAWGLFTTHRELGMDPTRARGIALWTSLLVFVVSLLYFAAKDNSRRPPDR